MRHESHQVIKVFPISNQEPLLYTRYLDLVMGRLTLSQTGEGRPLNILGAARVLLHLAELAILAKYSR